MLQLPLVYKLTWTFHVHENTIKGQVEGSKFTHNLAEILYFANSMYPWLRDWCQDIKNENTYRQLLQVPEQKLLKTKEAKDRKQKQLQIKTYFKWPNKNAFRYLQKDPTYILVGMWQEASLALNSVLHYIISSRMHAFWLVLTYDLLEDRRIADVIIKNFLILYYIKQIEFMLPCVCSVIDHWEHQNAVERTSVTHSAMDSELVCHFFVLTTFWRQLLSITERTGARQHGIYLLIVTEVALATNARLSDSKSC